MAEEKQIEELSSSSETQRKISEHYNSVSKSQISDYKNRKSSKIINLRNFNNFIKTCTIKDHINKLKSTRKEISALDICCGRGGDLGKWAREKIHYLICVDISPDSVEECKKRYYENPSNTFGAEFFVSDCSSENIWDRIKVNPKLVDITSCQFALHYSFQSYERASMMLHNACANLRSGGYFIGVIPNCYEINRLLLKNNEHLFENNILTLSMPNYSNSLFGAMYDFQLDELVDCPEYLVYFPLLERMLKPYNMKLNYAYPMPEFFLNNYESHIDTFIKMKALQTFPLKDIEEVTKQKNSQGFSFQHLKYEYYKRPVQFYKGKDIMTISEQEWAVAKLYTVFSFQRNDPIIDPHIDNLLNKSTDHKDEHETNGLFF